jgi:hypothetical protein
MQRRLSYFAEFIDRATLADEFLDRRQVACLRGAMEPFAIEPIFDAAYSFSHCFSHGQVYT